MFLTATQADDLQGLATSGIVGLSPSIKDSTNDLFVIKLKDSGIIDRAVFSLMIDLTHDSSKMTFGGYDLQNMVSLGSKLNYHKIETDEENNKWWTLKLNEFTLQRPFLTSRYDLKLG
jgi:hypothetical protein